MTSLALIMEVRGWHRKTMAAETGRWACTIKYLLNIEIIKGEQEQER